MRKPRTEAQKIARKLNDAKPENKEKKKLSDQKYKSKNIDKIKEYQSKYRTENKEKIAPAKRAYYDRNIDLCKERASIFSIKNREKIREKYHNGGKDKILNRLKERKTTDINFYLAVRGRNRTSLALHASGTKKLMSFDDALGCTIEDFKKHIESTFLDGMTWENRGNKDGHWVIDEIRPIASFDLSDIEQYKQCFHYSNRRALWHIDNCKKSSFWNGKRWKHEYHKKK